jgi:hypothetical protein
MIDEFEEAMAIRDSQIEFMKSAGYGLHTYEGFSQQQHLQRGEMDEYMSDMWARLKKGYILANGIQKNPRMELVREHPDYPEMLKLSVQNEEKQRQIYLDLVAKELGLDKSKETTIGQGT